MSINRRKLLISTAGLAAAGAIGTPFLRWEYARRKTRLGIRLAESLGESPGARQLGAAYLVRYPDEADIETLVSALVADMKAAPLLADSPRLWQLLQRRVRADFRQGRLVRLDGWVLSQTELRLCALAELGAGGADGAGRAE